MKTPRPARGRLLFLTAACVLVAIAAVLLVAKVMEGSRQSLVPVKLVESRQVQTGDEATRPYVASGTVQAYATDTGWADVGVMNAYSSASAVSLTQEIGALLQSQGFELIESKTGMQVYKRNWDPILQREAVEYVRMSLSGRQVVLARGSDADVVKASEQKAVEGAR